MRVAGVVVSVCLFFAAPECGNAAAGGAVAAEIARDIRPTMHLRRRFVSSRRCYVFNIRHDSPMDWKNLH